MANLDRQRLRRLLPYLGRDRKRLLLTMVLLIPVAGAAAVQPPGGTGDLGVAAGAGARLA